jgi:type II pantothenate kinase
MATKQPGQGLPSSEEKSHSGTRPRTATTTEEIDRSILHPGSVRINAEGAFIVDQASATPANGNGKANGRGSPGGHETKDIRLPNQQAVVSHIAIDVSHVFSYQAMSEC